MPGKNTAVSYQYRDGSNYKANHVAIFAGEITHDEVLRVLSTCDEGEWFIPGQVGLPDIQDRLQNFPDPEDDHVWHELEADSFELTDRAPTEAIDIHAFVERFCETTWDVAAQAEKIGLSFPNEGPGR